MMKTCIEIQQINFNNSCWKGRRYEITKVEIRQIKWTLNGKNNRHYKSQLQPRSVEHGIIGINTIQNNTIHEQQNKPRTTREEEYIDSCYVCTNDKYYFKCLT